MAAEGSNFVRKYTGEMIPIVRFTYTGADGEVIPREATHIFVEARKVRAEAFQYHRCIVEVICHEIVEKIEQDAFRLCPSLKRVIIRGVKVVEENAFEACNALEYVECDKLVIVGRHAFRDCGSSLRSINLPSARTVRMSAFSSCYVLANVKFGSKLERIEEMALSNCDSLERITIPLKNGLITRDDVFIGCDNLRQVDLIGGELHETVTAFHLEEWRNDMNREIDSINHLLPNAAAGGFGYGFDATDPGEKAQTIRRWIRSVLRKIIDYQEEHRRLLEQDVATTLQLVLSNSDIVMNNVLPFLELPSYTFDVGDDDEEDTDSSDDEE